MGWLQILTTILPIILEVINKPRSTQEQRDEMEAIGNDLIAIGVSNDVPELRLAGQYIACVAKGDEDRAGNLIRAAEQLDAMARARAAKEA